jgi:signal transduction histidine kinase
MPDSGDDCTAMPSVEPTDITRVLFELARDLGGALDPAEAVERTLDGLGQLLAVDGAVLWLDGPDGLQPAAAIPPGLAELPLADASLRATLTSLGQIVGELAIFVDADQALTATDHLLVEAAAVQLAASLERARLFQEVMELERLKSDFIARVSHELRTPITIINGFVDTLLAHDEQLDAAQRRHMLERSHAAAARLARLIEELLIVSRLEAGVLTPDPTAVPLAALIEEVRLEAVDPDLVGAFVPAGAEVRSDRSMLARALGCVIDNAIKYGGRADVVVAPDGGAWTITVTDEGPGFAPDIRANAFEMFTRGSATTAVPGLGVGLAIARTLLEVLNGAIDLDPGGGGRGASVRLVLPA